VCVCVHARMRKKQHKKNQINFHFIYGGKQQQPNEKSYLNVISEWL